MNDYKVFTVLACMHIYERTAYSHSEQACVERFTFHTIDMYLTFALLILGDI